MKKEITYEELQAAASYVQARLPYTPKVALVLGSGLGDFADRLTIDAKIPYGEIPHFPVSTVPLFSMRSVIAVCRSKKLITKTSQPSAARPHDKFSTIVSAPANPKSGIT